MPHQPWPLRMYRIVNNVSHRHRAEQSLLPSSLQSSSDNSRNPIMIALPGRIHQVDQMLNTYLTHHSSPEPTL